VDTPIGQDGRETAVRAEGEGFSDALSPNDTAASSGDANSRISSSVLRANPDGLFHRFPYYSFIPIPLLSCAKFLIYQ
jgi:hypothetical protein